MEELPISPPVRLRLYAVDANKGQPLAYITLQAQWKDGTKAGTVSPRLQTDANGFVSFLLEQPDGFLAPEIHVFAVHGPSNSEVFLPADLIGDTRPRLLPLDSATIYEPSATPQLPSTTAPDALDLEYADSLTHLPDLQLGGGLCGQLIPNSLSRQCYKFNVFAITDFTANSVLTRHAGGQATSSRRTYTGVMVEFEQCWNPVGHSIGQILNSFPLAPCESVSLAVLDYSRRERSARQESTTRTESSIYNAHHDSLQRETFTGMFSQISTDMGMTTGMDVLFVSMSMAIGMASTTQVATSNALSQVTENLQQSASAVAQQNSCIVMEASVEERKVLTTRTITNHNHCHALTIMYYEVMRNYTVITRARGSREVLMIECPTTPFTIHELQCNAYLLRQALLDPSLLACFDELAEALCCSDKSAQTGSPCDPKVCEGCCCVQLLLDHLNCHLDYYWTYIAAAMDTNSRIAWMMNSTYLGQPLLSMIDPNPVGVYGNFLVFPLLASPFTPATGIPPVIQRISLPTKGVFAEGLLGKCNTCEPKNDDVFWDFQTSPCGCGCSSTEVPEGFASPGNALLPGSGLGSAQIGNLINWPANPFGETSQLLPTLMSTFLNPELMNDPVALGVAKDVAASMAARWTEFIELLGTEDKSGNIKPFAEMVLSILQGFAGS